jgi:hypothetical protein
MDDGLGGSVLSMDLNKPIPPTEPSPAAPPHQNPDHNHWELWILSNFPVLKKLRNGGEVSNNGWKVMWPLLHGRKAIHYWSEPQPRECWLNNIDWLAENQDHQRFMERSAWNGIGKMRNSEWQIINLKIEIIDWGWSAGRLKQIGAITSFHYLTSTLSFPNFHQTLSTSKPLQSTELRQSCWYERFPEE